MVFIYKEYVNLELKKGETDISRFEADYDDAQFEFDNQNYIKAAKKYNSMLSYTSDRDNIIEIKRKIGFCYCLQGIIGEKDEENFYFDKAVSTLKEIFSMNIELSNEDISFIQYDLATIYLYYDDEIYFDELKKFANTLENKVEEKADLPCSICEAYFLLGMFYEKEYNINHYSEDLKKAKEYYSNALNFETKEDNPDMVKRILSFQYKECAAYFYLRYADHLLIEASKKSNEINDNTVVVNYFANLWESVSIYNDLLSTCSPDKFPSIYFRNVKDLARCYIFLNEPQKAYDNFKKFIYMDDEYLDQWITGSYIFATLELNQEDIDILLKRYHRLIDYYNEKSNIEEMCEKKFELMVCYYELFESQKNREYYNYGKKILDELNDKYYGYFNTKRDGLIKEYNKLYEEIGLHQQSDKQRIS